MKRRITAAFAAIALAAFAADMASQKWVVMKIVEAFDGSGAAEIAASNAVSRVVGPLVSEAVSNSLAVTKAISPMVVDAGTNGTIYAFFEPATVWTLSVTNSLNSAITNGALFAWVGDGVFTNAQLGAVTATTTNFVWNAVGSTVVDGVDTFVAPNGFGVTGTYLTPTDANKITGGGK